MKLELIAILIFSFQFDYLRSEVFDRNNEDIFSYQLHEYIDDYEQNQNPNSLWYTYLILNSINDSSDFFLELIKAKNHTFLNSSEFINCIKDFRENKTFKSFSSFFSYCSNNNSIKLAHLHTLDKDDQDYKYLFNSLDYNDLNKKQSFHYRYISTGDLKKEYSLDLDDLCILDFYFFDKINDYNSFHAVEAFLKEIKNSGFQKRGLNEIDNKLKFLVAINALYKLNMEYEVHNISKALDEFDNIPISKEFLRILNYISYSSYIQGFYQYDIDMYRNFILPVSSMLSKESLIRANIDYGVALYRIGNTSSSLKVFESLYEKRSLITDDRYYSALLNNLGIAYLNVGYFERYVQLQLQALNFSQENNDIYAQIHFLNNLYIYHRRIQNWNSAIDYLYKARNLAIEANEKTLFAEAELSFGTFHRDHNNDLSLSIKHLQNATELSKSNNNYELLEFSLHELAKTYAYNDQIDLALNKYKEAANLAEIRQNEWGFVYSYMNIAKIHLDNGDVTKASDYLYYVKNSDRQLMNFRNQVDRETILSKYYLLQNETDKALLTLKNYAEEIIYRSIHSSDIQSGHIYLEEEFLSLFKLFIKHLVENNLIHEAIYWMDEIKNLSSVTFYNNPALKSSILSENELVLDFALRNRIERLRHQLRTASEDKRIQLTTLLIEAVSQQNALRRKVLQNIDFEPVNMNRLRRELGRSDIILYFSIFHEDLYVSKISSGSFDIQKITLSDKDFNRIEDIVNSLSTDKVRLTELAWLKEKILGENGLPDRYTNYFIIPDGFLYHIPFEIFPVGNIASDYSYGKASYLIEHAAISYSNSLKDLKASLHHRPQRKYALDFIGYGITHFNNPESQLLPGRYLPALPLAEREVEDISTNLNSFNNNIFFDSNTATEYNFRQNSGSGRILHFATHSEVFENDPLYSVIYLNQENGGNRIVDSSNDGFVYAYELFQMDLSSEMVMLNSCESGSGNYIQGSGIVGFSRAFNYAGIPSLVMNLWSVRDRSAYHLSVSFYDYLNQGYSKSEAMRKAKIYYLNKFNSNPTNWGSFVVYGNIDPIVPSRNPWILVAVFLIIGAISLIVAWLRLPAKIRQRLQ